MFLIEIMLICERQKGFFTHNLNSHIMALFVYKLMRQAKLFCIYYINVDIGK